MSKINVVVTQLTAYNTAGIFTTVKTFAAQTRVEKVFCLHLF
jgi:hypothetical protein